MTILVVIIALFFMIIIGYSIIKAFDLIPGINDYERLPFAFGLGAGLVAFQLYFYSRLGIEWNNLIILMPWIIFILFSVYFKAISFDFKIKREGLTRSSIFLLILIIGLFSFAFVESILRPVPAWDGFASWQMRSKMFFIEGGLTQNIFNYIPSEYPEIISLMTVFLYKILGFIDDRNGMLLYPVFYLSLGVMFFSALKIKLNLGWSLFFTFLLLSTQNLVRHSGWIEAGQADMILGFYIFSSVILLLIFIKNKNLKTFILLQSYLIITTLTKNEGVAIIILIQGILVIYLLKNRMYSWFLLFLVWLLPFVEWQYFKHSLDLGRYPSYFGSVIHIDRVFLISKSYLKELLNIGNWNFVWISFLYSFFLYLIYLRKSKELFLLFLIVISQLFVYGGIFLFTTPDPNSHIPNVLNRALLHLLPLAVLIIGFVFGDLNINKIIKFKS